jgi:hypothetical protein
VFVPNGKDLELGHVLRSTEQAKARKMRKTLGVERLIEGSEQSEWVEGRSKDGKKKQSGNNGTNDDDGTGAASSWSSKEHKQLCPRRALPEKQRATREWKSKTKQSGEDDGHEWKSGEIRVARLV